MTSAYYDVDDSKVDWLSLVYIIASLPFGLLVIWMLDNRGLKDVVSFAHEFHYLPVIYSTVVI